MYYLVYGFFYLLSLLPLRVLYFIGDGIYGLLYYVFKYRRDVVMKNLEIAFPQKSLQEKTVIAKEFYHGFVDTFIEVIKMVSMSAKESARRVTGDYSAFEAVYQSGKSIHLHAMHNFNWELVQWSVARNVKYPFLGAYMPVSNKAFNTFFYKLRSKFGTILLPTNDFKNHFLKYSNNKYIIGLAADQNPGNLKSVYWASFFNKPTAFMAGPEKGVRAHDAAVMFVNFYRVKRGHYHFTAELVTLEPLLLPEGELTRMFIRYVEKCIHDRPANYLWSHRRWKHAWKEEYAPRWVCDQQARPVPVVPQG